MSTRSRVIIEGIAMYSHYDGYPEGMAIKLYNAIDHLYTIDFDIRKNPFINAFIAGNINNCELDISEKIGWLEYIYIIRGKNIKAYTANVDDTAKELFFDGLIFDFIKKYQKLRNYQNVFIDDDGDLYTEKNINDCYKYYDKKVKAYGDDNPNKEMVDNKARMILKARGVKC